MTQLEKDQKKADDYALKIATVIGRLFEDEDEDYYIDLNELEEDDNLTHFMHAIGNVVPHFIYRKFTNDVLDSHLHFNQLMNRICVQYMRVTK